VPAALPSDETERIARLDRRPEVGHGPTVLRQQARQLADPPRQRLAGGPVQLRQLQTGWSVDLDAKVCHVSSALKLQQPHVGCIRRPTRGGHDKRQEHTGQR
jgi:hypothetical protein